jgi:hypothetical protein
MTKKMFVVDRNLRAVSVDRLLEYRGKLRSGGSLGADTREAVGLPVLEGGQELLPNTVYSSATDPSVRYYLPEYRISVDDEGRPEVELRYGEADGGEVGRLTVTLTWSPPTVSEGELRAMDHSADLSLRYEVPIQNDDGASGVDKLAEETVPLQPLQQLGNLRATSTTIFMDEARFDVLYQAMINADRNTKLEIGITARAGIRTWKQIVVGQATVADQTAALKRRNALFTKIVSAKAPTRRSPAGHPTGARVTATQPSAETTERMKLLREALVKPRSVARRAVPTARVLEARPAAPVVLAQPMTARTAVTTARAPRRRGTPSVSVRTARPTASARTAVAAGRVVTARSAAPAPAATATAAAAPVAATNPRLIATAIKLQKPKARELSMILKPRLATAVLASDLKIKGRRVVPVQVALDTDEKPAIIDADLENRQELAFTFDPAEPSNRDVFIATEEFGRTIHLLLPIQLTTEDGSIHTVYQDNVMRDVVYIAPSEFRLVRDDETPFLPTLSFLASDFSTSDESAEAEVLFQIRVVYRLEPWLDPEVHELAREQLAREGEVARPTPIVPRNSTFRLDLDLLGDDQLRQGASIDPTIGITDELELDHDSFLRFWRERLANPGGAIRGRVEFQLYDGSPAQAPVEISFWEHTADVFDVSFSGPVSDAPGHYRVKVRNRIESPVEISDLPGEAVGEDAVAHALGQDSLVGRRLEPGEECNIDYRVQPEDAVVTTLRPTIVGRVEPDLPALLKELMVTPGYSSLSFSLTVKVGDGVFGPPPAGSEPLTGLMVEFDDGTRVTLTAEAPESEVTLVGRLIDQILGTADTEQRYLYRVTNIYPSGEGERTKWEEGHGTADLEIHAAAVQLDF